MAGQFQQDKLAFQTCEYPYVVYVPREYGQEENCQEKNWPAILFLHGSGERGNDGWKQSWEGIGRAVWENPHLYPAFIIMPQIPRWMEWKEDGLVVAVKVLDKVVQEFNIDPDRICLTGLSLGGSGAWNLAMQHPHMFASVIPIAAYSRPDDQIKKLTDLPIWSFHGARDEICECEHARDMVRALEQLGSARVRYTEYADAGHVETWQRAYADEAMARWLLAQRRAGPAPGRRAGTK